MSDDSEKALSCVGLMALMAISMVFGAFMSGLTISYLWSWFMVPLFGLPVLTKAAACGLGILVRSMTWHAPAYKKNDDTDAVGQLIYAMCSSVVMTVILLSMGYIVSSFLPPTQPPAKIAEVESTK